MSELTHFLKQADIFYQFTPAQLDLVASLCREKTYSMGEDIVRESAPTKELYIIAEGEVQVLVTPALVGGPEAASGMVSIATLREGQSFGEIALVDANPELAEAQALDLAHGLPYYPSVQIRVGEKRDYADAQVIVITAGASARITASSGRSL